MGADSQHLAAETLTISELVDSLGLFMMEAYQRAREEVIIRQQTEITELSNAGGEAVAGRAGIAADRHTGFGAHTRW